MTVRWVGRTLIAVAASAALLGSGAIAPSTIRSGITYELPARSAAQVLTLKPTSVAYVGDSISATDPPFAGDIAQSWVPTALIAPLYLQGAYAYPGAKIADILPMVSDIDSDVLVIMIGTNDMYWDTPLEERYADLDVMVARVHPDLAIVSTVAPYNPRPWLSGEWNTELEQYASDRGYLFVDPWAAVRDGELWAAGADYGDGIHPSPSSASIIGSVMQQVILTALLES